jgi:hypothetical protein
MATWATEQAANITSAARWDAEFFVNPYNGFLEDLFSRWGAWVSLDDASVKLTSGHTPYHHDVSEGDTPFVTVECVDPLGINFGKTKRIWAHQASGELARVCVKKGDVLITIKRRIGNSCPVVEDLGLLAVNQDVVVMTPKGGMNPSFISAVLNSRVGKFQALRLSTEQMNPYINVETLGKVLVPLVEGDVQRKIANVVEERLAALKRCEDAYREAEAELLDRLGWDTLQSQPAELSYECSFSSLNGNARVDAEFFQPKNARLRERLEQRGAAELASVQISAAKGITPEYDDEGDCLAVNSQHLGPQGIDYANLNRVRRSFFDTVAKTPACVRRGDVLTYATGAYVGRTNAWLIDEPAVAGIDCLITRVNEKLCSPGYLALFLNSPAGQAQAIRAASGSAQRHIYLRDMEKFLIFLPQGKDGKVDLAWQQHLAAKVEASVAARATASAKLEEATRLVEEALQVPLAV